MSSRCYYEILEISREAEEGDVRKAYRKMALRWHPDKNPDNKEEAEERFKEISEAYEVLSDKSKRVIYDRYGKEGLVNGVDAGGGNAGSSGPGPSRARAGSSRGFQGGQPFCFSFRDPLDVFREFFGGRDPFADLFNGGGLFGGIFGGRDPFGLDPFGLDPFASLGNPFSLAGPNLFETTTTTSHPRNDRRVMRVADSRQRAQPYATSRQQQQQHRQQQQQQQQLQTLPPMMGPSMFGLSPFGSLFGPTASFASFGFPGGAGGANFTSSSSSVKIVNGRRVVTKKVVQNGTETVTVEENGRITSKTVNGVPQRVN